MFLRYNVIVKEPIISSIETIYHFDRNFRPGFARYGDVKLYQIGRRYCSPGEIIGSHVHVDWFELTVITGEPIISPGEQYLRPIWYSFTSP